MAEPAKAGDLDHSRAELARVVSDLDQLVDELRTVIGNLRNEDTGGARRSQ